MNNKGFTLSSFRMDDRAPLSRNQLFILVLGLAVVLFVTTTIFSSLPANISNVSSGLAVKAERYGAAAFDAELSSAANTARWVAMGEQYSTVAFDAELRSDAKTARWQAQRKR